MKGLGQPCEIEERLCIECGECDRCEIDPQKICNNCFACIDKQIKTDYAVIEIDDILLNTENVKKSDINIKKYIFKDKK